MYAPTLNTSNFGKKNPNYIYQKSNYYYKVLSWFSEYEDELFIKSLDSIFAINPNYYAVVKMNGYSFNFDDKGKIVASSIYDRTAFRDRKINNLRPLLSQMQMFADKSKFLEFYRQNNSAYVEQINFYGDTLDLPEMQKWLNTNFPEASDFDCYNIILSPLVSYNQSSTWFESNGFKELHAHVNFPYNQDFKRLDPISKQAKNIYMGNIVFTEINHGYLNSEDEKYKKRIAGSVSNRDIWVDSTVGPNYYAGPRVFNEYMNWGLISLRIVDYVDESEQEKLIARVERSMVRGRKFIKFNEFNQFLVSIYRNKNEGETVADLYPQIIDWFAINNQKDN